MNITLTITRNKRILRIVNNFISQRVLDNTLHTSIIANNTTEIIITHIIQPLNKMNKRINDTNDINEDESVNTLI